MRALHLVVLSGLIVLAVQPSASNLFGQTGPIKFERFSPAQGLLQSSVTCILQDRKGFLWFGTYDGLNKYDGYGFTIYKHEALDSNSLSYNGISSLCEDRAGNLWIGTAGGGLNKLDRAQEQFTRFVNDPKNPYSLSHNQVTSIHEDRTGNLWIGTFGGGLNKFDRVTERFTRLVNDPKNPHSLSHNQVTSIYEDRSDNLWIGTAGGGLNKIVASTSSEQVPSTSEKLNNPDSASEEFKVKSGRFIHFVNDSKNPNSLSSNDVRAIFEDPLLPNTLWIGTRDGGLNKLVVPRQNHSDASLKNANEKSGQFTCYLNDPKNPFSLGVNEVRAIFADSSSNALWVGTFGGGLNRFDYATARFIRLVNDPNDPASLSDNRVLSIYQTSASRNILWIGTQGGGLNRIVFEKKPFTDFTNDPKNSHSLCNNRVWAIHQDRAGMLWIGTQEGLNQFNRESGEWTCFANDPKNPYSLSHNNVRAIYEDHTGALWIGTYGGGLNQLDPHRQRFTRFLNDPQNPHSLSHDSVRVIYEDHTGTLWIGTHGGGLNRLVLPPRRDSGQMQFQRYLHDSLNPYSLSHNRVWSIYEDRYGVLWIGTSGGLNKFDREQGQFLRYVNEPQNPRSLGHNAVFSIFEPTRGQPATDALWIGTYGGGLNKFDRGTGQFTHYTTSDGLSNNAVYGITEDDEGCLWLSTNGGLSRFDPSRLAGKAFRNYDQNDGLQSNEFNAGAYLKSKSGEMFFGGVNGMNAFYPNRLKDDAHAPPVVITAFKIFDKPAKFSRALDALEALTLSYQENFFAFEFAALSYTNPQKNQYAYKMEGFDRDWIYRSSNRRYASYTNLDPGSYVFRVKGSNHDGAWNEEGTAIRLTIAPPWWRTGWAYALYALLLIAGAGVVHRVQHRRVIAKERSQSQILEAELRAEAAEAQAKALQAENERKRNVELLSEIGKEITASLEFETIFYKLYEHVNQLADASIFGVGIYHPEQQQIEYRLAIGKGKRYAPYTRDTSDKNQFPVWCIENRQPIFINDVAAEYNRYIRRYEESGRVLTDGTAVEKPQSLIYLPLIAHERVLGVITIQSFRKNAYAEHHLNLLQNLAAYTTIALDNADAYRQLDTTLQNLKATQAQLIHAEKMASLGQLTAGIAHEIKNPLNFVNNFSALTLDLTKELRGTLEAQNEKLDAEAKANVQEVLQFLEQNVTKINEHGKRADSIVRNMLMHSRGETGERRPAEVNAILDEYVMLAYHGMRGTDSSFNIKIEKAYDAAIGRVAVYPQDLSRVFLNIVNNACYATHEKKKMLGEAFSPVLTVQTKNLGDKIEIRIRDNGNGIPVDIREKIFNPFFTTKPTGQGTGLGLSISYDIVVQQHGGEIRVESEAGKFTEFVISLPKMA